MTATVASYVTSEIQVTGLNHFSKSFDLDPAKFVMKADLTSEADVKQMREKTEAFLGPVDVLANVVGASTNGMSWKLTVEDFKNVLDANLLTTFLTSREFIPSMRARNWGRIVNFSSIVGLTGVAGASHYCAAKAGILGFTKALSLELANKNITVNAIALGYFDHGLIRDVSQPMKDGLIERIPVKRLGQGSEVAGLLKYLMSDEAAFMTGQCLNLNGGQF